MRALVISGGGSKGAFAGGVSQYLLEVQNNKYDLFIGTSTGSLLIPHLALGKIDKIYSVFTEVSMSKIFDVNPFIVKNRNGNHVVSINHFNVIKQFLRRRRTFGESKKLLKYIKESFAIEEFEQLKTLKADIVITSRIFPKTKRNINQFMIALMMNFAIGFGFQVIIFPL